MKLARLFGSGFALLALVMVAVLYTRTPVRGFNVQDSPTLLARPSGDISDVYLFPSPANPANVVAVMNLREPITPSMNATPPAFFDQKVLYTMHFDNNYQSEAVGARPVDDLVIQFSVGAVSANQQQIYVYGPAKPNQTSATTTLLNGGTATAIGLFNRSFVSVDGMTVFAGLRQDPFFFDLAQFYQILPDRNQGSTAAGCGCGFNNPGTDYFAGTDVLSIVVEMPRAEIAPPGTGPIVAYWATTSTETGQ